MAYSSRGITDLTQTTIKSVLFVDTISMVALRED